MKRSISVIALAMLLLAGVACNSNKEAANTANNPDTNTAATTAPGNNAAPGQQATNATPAPAASTPQKAAEPAPPPPEPPKPTVIPAGTTITVKLQEAVGSKTSQTGDAFTATVAEPVVVGGKTVIPAGADARGKVLEAQAKGKIKGEARLKLALTRVTIKGENYDVATSMSSHTEKGKGKRTAVATGGGAAAGALIGGIAGGGKGAGIGALVGAGAGFVGGTFTGNKQIEIPAESALSFDLTSPLTIPPGKGD
jgi:type IV secretory pathway VirB10-like protein